MVINFKERARSGERETEKERGRNIIVKEKHLHPYGGSNPQPFGVCGDAPATPPSQGPPLFIIHYLLKLESKQTELFLIGHNLGTEIVSSGLEHHPPTTSPPIV